MKMSFLAGVTLVAAIGLVSPAQTRPNTVTLAPECNVTMPCEGGFYSDNAKRFLYVPFGMPLQHYTPQRHVKQVVPASKHHSAASLSNGPRPRAWCGWYMALRKGLSDARLNLAANWAKLYGHASGPQPGAVVVWRHHVGELVSHVKGNNWVVLSGNDGHRVRTRERNISKAIAFRM